MQAMAGHCGEMPFTLSSLKVSQLVFLEPPMNTSSTEDFFRIILEKTAFHLNLTILIRVVF